MVAARDLSPGELILREKPAIHGPNLDKSKPICVVCYKLLVDGDNFRPCDKCKVPLCSKACGLSEAHLPECEVFRRCPQGFYNKYDQGRILVQSKPSLQHANFQLIIPLR